MMMIMMMMMMMVIMIMMTMMMMMTLMTMMMTLMTMMMTTCNAKLELLPTNGTVTVIVSLLKPFFNLNKLKFSKHVLPVQHILQSN